MDKHYTYLLINLVAVFFPFVLSFDKKVAFYKQWKYLLRGLIPTGLFFLFWDAIFTNWGVWSFNEEYIVGPRIAGLPIEEWLFFLTVPYSCVFIYECLLHYVPAFNQSRPTTNDLGPMPNDWAWTVFPVVGGVLLLAGLYFHTRIYTFFAFAGSGAGLLAAWVFRSHLGGFRADAFLLMYLISIIPFLLVNGFLTALPVVIYNDAENLGIRMYTIPFEDLLYGLLLMLGNVVGLEWGRRRGLVKN